tara:strand:- start:89 stop:451 length:363 start_codon:yes stop_codon:yes gene_type:complete
MHKLRVACPCCGLTTLAGRSLYGICRVCWWEDDGQDDADADEVRGSPNHDYSLTTARANYRRHGHMYDSGEGIMVVERPSPERQALVKYALSVTRGEQPLDMTRLTDLMQRDYDARLGAR